MCHQFDVILTERHSFSIPPGSIAIYLEPWHADIIEFLDLKKNHGNEMERARDLFYAMWIPDLFMKRVEQNGTWSLFCPNEAKGLPDVWGDEFEALYEKYEKEGKARKTMPAQDLWFQILTAQVETGKCSYIFCNALTFISSFLLLPPPSPLPYLPLQTFYSILHPLQKSF